MEWQRSEDFQSKLVEVLVSELQLSGPDDSRGFNRKLGATATGEYDYFNATRNGVVGAVEAVEAWQILSPLRGMPFGVGDINRQIHERFRSWVCRAGKSSVAIDTEAFRRRTDRLW